MTQPLQRVLIGLTCASISTIRVSKKPYSEFLRWVDGCRIRKFVGDGFAGALRSDGIMYTFRVDYRAGRVAMEGADGGMLGSLHVETGQTQPDCLLIGPMQEEVEDLWSTAAQDSSSSRGGEAGQHIALTSACVELIEIEK
jgi:hypothetical protein